MTQKIKQTFINLSLLSDKYDKKMPPMWYSNR